MKTLIFLSLLAGAMSCAPTPNQPDRPENKMVHDPESQPLTSATPMRTVKISLVCGCGFPLNVDGMGGDTAIVKYSSPTVITQDTFHINVSAKVAGLPNGTYTSWLALSTPDVFKGALRDTIYDTLTIP